MKIKPFDLIQIPWIREPDPLQHLLPDGWRRVEGQEIAYDEIMFRESLRKRKRITRRRFKLSTRRSIINHHP